MVGSNTFVDTEIYAGNAQCAVVPSGTDRCNGVCVGYSLPAKWWNGMWCDATNKLHSAYSMVDNIYTELASLIIASGQELGEEDQLTNIFYGDSIHFGAGSESNGEESVAIGNSAESCGNQSIVIGAVSTSYCAGGITIGNQSESCGDVITIGNNSRSYAVCDNINIGNCSNLCIPYTISIGNYNLQCVNCGTSNIVIGHNVAQNNVRICQATLIGNCICGLNASVGIGYKAGNRIRSTLQNVVIGTEALGDNVCSSNYGANTVIGYHAGYSLIGGETVIVGFNAGAYACACGSVLVGLAAGCRICGTRTIAIGAEAGYSAFAHCSIFIGNKAGCSAKCGSSPLNCSIIIGNGFTTPPESKNGTFVIGARCIGNNSSCNNYLFTCCCSLYWCYDTCLVKIACGCCDDD